MSPAPDEEKLIERITDEENRGNFFLAARLAEEASLGQDEVVRLYFEGLRRMIVVDRNFHGAAEFIRQQHLDKETIKDLIGQTLEDAQAIAATKGTTEAFDVDTLQQQQLTTQIRKLAGKLGVSV
jgi:hypothetical protein